MTVASRLQATLLVIVTFCRTTLAGDDNRTAVDETPYPLGQSLRVLENDLTSKEYAHVLATMIPTDLEAEWKRVATLDNHETFLKVHGGKAKVLADPALKAAYQRRVKIAEDFLNLMREAYKKRGLVAPFDKGETVDLLAAGAKSSTGELVESPAVRVVLPATGAEHQWPRFRGPTGQGTALESAFPLHWSPSENIAWKSEIPGRGNGSPVIWGNQIFIVSANDVGTERWLLCYERSNGKMLWQETAPPPSQSETLYSKNTYASSTPVTDGERVIAFFGNSGLVCYDFSGRRLWHRDLGLFPTGHGPGASPVLHKNLVFLAQDQNQGESFFAAFDKVTGEKLWQQPRANAMCWTTPVVVRVGDRDELIHNGSYKVISYDPPTGEPLWTVEGPSRESIPMIVVGGGLIFSMSGRNGPMLAIRPGGSGDVTTTHVAWQLPRGGPHVSSPTYFNGRLYFVNDTGIATCLDAKTGATLWQERLPGRFSMSPIEAGGKLILTSEAGTTYILEAGRTFNLLATNDLGEGVLATPALLGGKLYFRTTGALVCVAEE